LGNQRLLSDTKHKYGDVFPQFKALQLDGCPVVDEKEDQSTTSARIAPSALPSKLFDAKFVDKHIATIVQSLFSYVDITFATSGNFFKLVSDQCIDTQPPKWAAHFDKMNGVIREPGRLIVQIPSRKTTLSVPQWHNSHPYLQFVNAVYVCRRSSTNIDQEAFSDVLGGSEQKLATNLHAVLIAGLSILSIIGGDGLVEKLVMAILGDQLSSIQSVPSNDISVEWHVHNRRRCPCNTQSVHRPLSPVAAAKAVGMDIWRERHDHIVNRVWDLHQDKLVGNIDSSKVIFVTHRWSDVEVGYQDVMERKQANGQAVGVSKMSEKLRRIRKSLQEYTEYVWIDTICIDKSNLSELDEAIRSMYKWYASCAAVVLDSDTTLDVWRSRGWCLQEGAAAGILRGITREGRLATIQQLATEQVQDLCTLDLHLYYRTGNAAEILTRMDIRKTTRDEDMAYALAGIFSIDLTLSYGEGIRSRARLLHQLAIQNGDLSFLTFQTSQTSYVNYLPATGVTYHLISNCAIASAPIMVSHFGICIEVQLVSPQNVSQIMHMLNRWKDYTFAKDRFLGLEDLLEAAKGREIQTSPSVQLAIVHDIRSLILVEIYDKDLQTGGGLPINLCYRLQCCQIEENEFERLFDETTAEFERIWLGDKPERAGTTIVRGAQYRRRDRRRRRIGDINESSDLG
jgi:Heterokaryon incompatibility protein (HET)